MNYLRRTQIILAGMAFGTIALVAVSSGSGHQAGVPLPVRSIADYHMELMDQSVDIVAVCKYDESSAMCWRPNGQPNAELTARIMAGLKGNNDTNLRSFQITYGRKHRALVLRTKRPNNTSQYLNLSVDPSSKSDQTGWNSYSGLFGNASFNDFDGSTTSWSVFDGIFDLKERESSITFVNSSSDPRPKSIPLQLGRFKSDENTFEITAIGPAPTVTAKPPAGYILAKPPKFQVTIKVVEIKNPRATMYLNVGNEAGAPFSYAFPDGKPATYEDYNKWQAQHPYKPGQPAPQTPFVYPGGFSFDPLSGIPSTPLTMQVFVSQEYCKTIIVNTTAREYFRFEGLKLEPN